MRISAFSKAVIAPIAIDRTMTVFEWIELARSLPADGLEMHSGFFWDTSPDGVDRVGDAVRDAGFEIPILCASPDFTHPDADQRAREFDRVRLF